MLPLTHGKQYTEEHIWYYSILTTLATLLPYLILAFGAIYLIGIIPLNVRWLQLAWHIKKGRTPPMKLFTYSILYLMLLFILMIIDHYFYIPL